MAEGKRRRTTKAEAGPDEIDVCVGQKVREARVLIGMSQMALAAKIGVSFQAVQKYEKGDIRVSASTLVRIATALDHEPGYFFEGLSAKGDPVANPGVDIRPRQLLDVVRAYQRLPEHLRLLFLQVMRSCARD
jgi:transcriptional regulator with XRE-family HTH domain